MSALLWLLIGLFILLYACASYDYYKHGVEYESRKNVDYRKSIFHNNE